MAQTCARAYVMRGVRLDPRELRTTPVFHILNIEDNFNLGGFSELESYTCSVRVSLPDEIEQVCRSLNLIIGIISCVRGVINH